MLKIVSKIRFRDQFIKNKILAIYIPLIIIPLVILGYVSNYFFMQAIINDSAPKTPTFFVFMDSVTNMSHIPLLIRFSLLMVEYGV